MERIPRAAHRRRILGHALPPSAEETRSYGQIFVILPRDQAAGVTEESQLFKTVRVVATIDYYLN